MAKTLVVDFAWIDALGIPITVVAAYVVHEILHLVPYWLSGRECELTIAPGAESWPGVARELTVGRAVRIRSVEPAPRWFVLLSSLMPILALGPALWAWAQLLAAPTISLRWAAYLALLVIVWLPSTIDLKIAAATLQRQPE